MRWESDTLFLYPEQQSFTIGILSEGTLAGLHDRLVSYYELKDATTTFELASWRSKLDQADASNATNRAAYRIDVPGPVKDTMLQYLDHC